MKKREVVWFTIPFLILAIGFTIAIYRQEVQKKRDSTQEGFLNRRFDSVQLQNGRIVMKPTTHFFPTFDEKAKALSVGDRFEYSDRHWHGRYRIIGITADGALIHYDRSGSYPANNGNWSGTVTIRWK